MSIRVVVVALRLVLNLTTAIIFLGDATFLLTIGSFLLRVELLCSRPPSTFTKSFFSVCFPKEATVVSNFGGFVWEVLKGVGVDGAGGNLPFFFDFFRFFGGNLPFFALYPRTTGK